MAKIIDIKTWKKRKENKHQITLEELSEKIDQAIEELYRMREKRDARKRP